MPKPLVFLLAGLLILAGCSRGLDFGDDPSKAFEKTDKRMTAPPPELRDGTATEHAPTMNRASP